MNYTEMTVPLSGIASAPSDNDVLGYMPTVEDIFVQRLQVIVETASTESTAAIVVETDEATPTEIISLTVGTSAAKTQLTAVPATDALKRVAAGTGIRVRADNAHTNGLSHWQLYTSSPS